MSDPTGYGESSDTTDGPVAEDQKGDAAEGDAAEGDAVLTTDDEAQHDDGIVRPGNAPD